MARRVSREFAPLPDPAPLPSEPQPPRAEQERCLSAACLDACAIIAVSAVGAGFLVIPTIIDAAGGVLPTAVGLTLAWFFLALGGIAYVEAATRILRQNEAGGASIFAVGRLTLTLTLPLPLSISLPLPVPLTRWQGRVRLSSY